MPTPPVIERLFDWLPLAILAALAIINRLRARVMRRRGVRVVIVDFKRPIGEIFYDTVVIAVFLCWLYFVLAEALPLPIPWMPEWLATKILHEMPLRLLGVAMIVAAPFLFAAALISFEDSWRIGIDREQPGALVTRGVFSWTRNPIYFAFDLFIAGTFLIHGRVIYLILGAVLILLIHGVVLREERFLSQQYGDAFHEYRSRVRRYGIF